VVEKGARPAMGMLAIPTTTSPRRARMNLIIDTKPDHNLVTLDIPMEDEHITVTLRIARKDMKLSELQTEVLLAARKRLLQIQKAIDTA